MTPSELRKARLRAGLTQAQLARQFGCAVKTIQRWESGETAIPPIASYALQSFFAAPPHTRPRRRH